MGVSTKRPRCQVLVGSGRCGRDAGGKTYNGVANLYACQWHEELIGVGLSYYRWHKGMES